MNSKFASTDQVDENRVLMPDYAPSSNFLDSDLHFKAHVEAVLSADARDFLWPHLHQLGAAAATVMDQLSLRADQEGPVLVKRNAMGEEVDEIRFHPAYDRLMAYAVDSQMLRLKWEPALRQRFHGQRHRMGFAAGYLYAMAESGQYCPLCMTDGVAHLLDRFASPGDRDRLLPHIAAAEVENFYTGAMFLTEKAGGSDVGANLVRAEQVDGRRYRLYGEKWFCSNVNAEVIFALARTRAERSGTHGLSIFLVEPRRADGSRNPMNIVRLKDKLGVRSMASAECLLNGTEATLIGEEFQGFRIMAEMINLSRLYNSIAALAGGRRALVEAFQFLQARSSFGKRAVEHALVREKLWELGTLHLLSFHLVWRAIGALDAAEAGDAPSGELLRLLTPMAKRDSAEKAVYMARESMELMGGLGYIEDTIMPKIMRDMMVLPIWEGAGNIMLLDMLRAMLKSKGLSVLAAEVRARLAPSPSARSGRMLAELDNILHGLGQLEHLERDEAEFRAKPLLLELTQLYQESLLYPAAMADPTGAEAIALRRLDHERSPGTTGLPTVAEIRSLLGWKH